MPEIRSIPGTNRPLPSLTGDIDRACVLIPPAWDLRSFVAVNPFIGHAASPFDAAARTVSDGLGAQVLPPVDHYRLRWKQEAFSREDVAAAAHRMGMPMDRLLGALDGTAHPQQRFRLPNRTIAEWIDWRNGTRWNVTVCDALARWCESESADPKALDATMSPRPFARWRRFAEIDRSVDAAGLRGFRAAVASMPEEPNEAISLVLEELGIDAIERDAYLLRLLSGIYGWATQARRIAWQRDRDHPGAVRDLLAARACADLAVARVAARPGTAIRGGEGIGGVPVEDERFRLTLQEAAEDGFVRGLLATIRPPEQRQHGMRPAIQAVFCIDVRSELVRRHLERRSDAVETKGFAGFFGVAVDWVEAGQPSARCPVLLHPNCTVHAHAPSDPVGAGLAARLHGSPGSAFAMVEVAGAAYGARMVLDEALPGSPDRGEERASFGMQPEDDGSGIGLDTRIRTADAILRGMGMHGGFAPLVFLCGHSARSANNPHAASLDCGACGGHGGAPNARIACAILNDPRVRAALPDRGWPIPEDTLFVPAVHDTSDDTIRILDEHCIPASHFGALGRARALFDEAGAAVRAERAPHLGMAERGRGRLLRAFRRRTRDWAQVRPEWALAGNAAFIAARRSRTRGVDLAGRAFLHEYDHEADLDGRVLDLILTAPMVVASWINLQYLASTVDNEVLGAGDKALHDRVGAIGVAVGNGGDLRSGLPLQSVQAADGRWRHEPLRLQVIVEARTERIDAVLDARPQVRELVENGWVRLFSLDPQGGATQRLVPGEGWEPA